MAEIQDKLVDVKGLGAVYKRLSERISVVLDDLQDAINNKLTKATNVALPGQVLVADGNFSWSWKNMSSSVDEADIRRIVNEQLAKTKYTINDQGHLIIETPEA